MHSVVLGGLPCMIDVVITIIKESIMSTLIVIFIDSITKSIDPGLSVQKLLELLLNVINQGVPTPDHKDCIWDACYSS